MNHEELVMSSVRQLFQKAVMLIRHRDLLEAERCLDDLLLLDDRHPDALACRGWIHALYGRDDLARADLEAALKYARPDWARRADVESQLGLEHVSHA
jgi:regulator of sirC expression with transglutaminase-like and TPR domain